MQSTNLVPIRIAHIAQVQPTHGTLAPARWVFASDAAVGHTSIMESAALFGRLHGKAYGAAVAVGGFFAIDRVGDAEAAGGAAVEIALSAAGCGIGNTGADVDRAKQGIVKNL